MQKGTHAMPLNQDNVQMFDSVPSTELMTPANNEGFQNQQNDRWINGETQVVNVQETAELYRSGERILNVQRHVQRDIFADRSVFFDEGGHDEHSVICVSNSLVRVSEVSNTPAVIPRKGTDASVRNAIRRRFKKGKMM